MTEGYKRLIEPWTLTITIDEKARVPYAGISAREFPALLDMLQGHVIPDTGKTIGGANTPATRSVLDVKSLDLLMHIEDVTEAWLNEWRMPRDGDVKTNMRAFWNHLHTLYATGTIDQAMFEHLQSYPDTWATNIWDLIEPPLRLPMRGSGCPKCGRTKITTTNDEQTDNLLIIWRDNQEPTVECQWADCGAIWVGEPGMIELGRALNMEIDMEKIEEARHARMTTV